MLCLSCFRWSPSGSPFCSGCGRSFGARYCGAKKRHYNAMNAQFCAQCGSERLTDPTLYLPISWLLRGLLIMGLFFIARGAGPFLWPVVEREFCVLMKRLCPAFNVLLNWALSAALLYFVVWIFASLLPSELGKPIQNVMRAIMNLFFKTLKGMLHSVFRLIWRLLAGNSKPQST